MIRCGSQPTARQTRLTLPGFTAPGHSLERPIEGMFLLPVEEDPIVIALAAHVEASARRRAAREHLLKLVRREVIPQVDPVAETTGSMWWRQP